jgi:uncharacterized protein YkwD
MLITVGTLCAYLAISTTPATAPATNAAKPAAPPAAATATAKAPQAAKNPAPQAAKNTAPQTVKKAAPAAAIPNAAKPAAAPSKAPIAATKPAPNAAAGKQAKPQPRVANKPVTPELHPLESAVIERTNNERTRRGLRPLALDFGLLTSARRHAAWMTQRRSLQHTNQPVAENIAMGQNSSVEVVSDWMSSPGHRANILNASYSRIGVAAYTASNGQVYWCQQFMH